MHMKLYMHENLTAPENFYKIFQCKLQNPNPADKFQQLQNFSCAFPTITWKQNFVIVIIYSFHGISIFYYTPWNISYATDVSQ